MLYYASHVFFDYKESIIDLCALKKVTIPQGRAPSSNPLNNSIETLANFQKQ